jgi:hypothetical protein
MHASPQHDIEMRCYLDLILLSDIFLTHGFAAANSYQFSPSSTGSAPGAWRPDLRRSLVMRRPAKSVNAFPAPLLPIVCPMVGLRHHNFVGSWR